MTPLAVSLNGTEALAGCPWLSYVNRPALPVLKTEKSPTSESHEVGGMTLKLNSFAVCPSYGLPLAVHLQRSSVWAYTRS